MLKKQIETWFSLVKISRTKYTPIIVQLDIQTNINKYLVFKLFNI